jgi:aminotransferase
MPRINSGSVKSPASFLSQRVNAIAPSGIRKFFDLLSSMEGVISLSIGEPDFVTPWHIRDAAMNSLERGYTMYTSNYGLPELRQRLAEYLELNYGVIYNPESEILITVGVSEGLDLILRAVLNTGDEVIIPDPCYVAYRSDIILAGGTAISVPTYEENNFVIRAEDIEAQITKQTKVILIGYPANPTGAVSTREELIEIAELARKYNLLVISDEIYARLVYGVGHTCFSSLPGMKEQTILLGGFSKSYAMTGWRIGYIAGNQELIGAATKIHQYTMLSAPTIAQMAAIEALKNGEKDTKRMVQEYDGRRRIIVKRLNEIGLHCFEPKGAFYAFPSIRSTGMSSEEFSEKLLIEEKVAVVPGTAFGKHGEGFIRCCYATSLTNIEEALSRMSRFIKKNH